MTDLELDAIEQRLNAATPGPWTTEKPKADDDGWANGVVIAATYGGQGIFAKSGKPARTKPVGRVYATPPGGQMPAADQAFIAHAREDVEALVAEVRRLREERGEIVGCWNEMKGAPNSGSWWIHLDRILMREAGE